MRHAELRAIVHNLADSLASGHSYLLSSFGGEVDVYTEAAQSPGGMLTLDVMSGKIIEGEASPLLVRLAALCPDALAKLCSNASGSIDDLQAATVRYTANHLGERFAITVTDAKGRRSTAEYRGIPGKRVTAL